MSPNLIEQQAQAIINLSYNGEKRKMLEEARNAIMAEDAYHLLEDELNRSGMTEDELREL